PFKVASMRMLSHWKDSFLAVHNLSQEFGIVGTFPFDVKNLDKPLRGFARGTSCKATRWRPLPRVGDPWEGKRRTENGTKSYSESISIWDVQEQKYHIASRC